MIRSETIPSNLFSKKNKIDSLVHTIESHFSHILISSLSSFACALSLSIDFNRSNGSINTLTNELKEDMTPILIKKKSHSAPESDTSADSIYEAMPEPKKKLSLDETSSKRASNASTITEFLKEKSQRKLQEKDLDEASNCSSLSRMKSTASPAGTLRSVSRRELAITTFT